MMKIDFHDRPSMLQLAFWLFFFVTVLILMALS